MADRARPLVVRSIETPQGDRCVDIFRRDDGSFGFESYRRDPEDGRGWFPVTYFSERRFSTAADAFSEACSVISWLRDAAADAGQG